jgi:hypothetical protein
MLQVEAVGATGAITIADTTAAFCGRIKGENIKRA